MMEKYKVIYVVRSQHEDIDAHIILLWADL